MKVERVEQKLNPIMMRCREMFVTFNTVFMIGLCLHISWIDRVECSPLEIGRGETSSSSSPSSSSPPLSIPELNGIENTAALDYLDYTSSLEELSTLEQLSSLAKKGREKSDSVNPVSLDDCGTGLEITEVTMDETMLVSMRESGSGSDPYFGPGSSSDPYLGSGSSSDPFPLTSTRIKAGNQSIVPWQAYIRARGASNAICGGSLLNPTWVLTAQHCEIKAGKFEVFFGANAPRSDETGYQIRTVINRPGYNEKNHDNDFSLIQLTKPVTFTKQIKPACLPRPGQKYDDTAAVSSGWGHTRSGKGPFPSSLLSTHLIINSTRDCNHFFLSDNAYLLTQNQICATVAYVPHNSRLCQGDSGGPLMVKTTHDRYLLVGVVSATYSSCGKYVIFGQVADPAINKWIVSNAFKKSAD